MLNFDKIKKSKKLILIAGPCVIENEKTTFEIAEKLKIISNKFEIPFIFKASYQKANRTKWNSYSGPGIDKGLEILKKIKDDLHLALTTDVHSVNDVKKVNKIIDIIQIPAFLSRQTDILVAAAKTNKIINVKKAPFLSGESCKFILQKINKSGNLNTIITERGNSFGYHNLIVDMRNIPIIKKNNVPVIIDATHSNQKPNQKTGKSGGTPKFIETIACAGIASGADGVFVETHPNPSLSLSDGSNMLKIDKLEPLIEKLIAIKKIIN